MRDRWIRWLGTMWREPVNEATTWIYKPFVNPHCSTPSAYGLMDRVGTEIEATYLIGALVLAHKPQLTLEIGMGWGDTAVHIAQCHEVNGLGGRHVAIETDPERAMAGYNWAIDRGIGVSLMSGDHHKEGTWGGPAGRPRSLEIVRTDWRNYQPPVTGPDIGLLFVDAEVAARTESFHHVRQRLEPRALVVWHDTSETFQGDPPGNNVAAQVRALRQESWLEEVFAIDTPKGLTISRVA